MATFTGTNADETITPVLVSATVTTSGGATPSGADDTIIAGGGADTIDGGGGNDELTGGVGNDLISGGTGADRIIWNPGDGSDTVEGQADSDTLDFFGANIAENIDISANGPRVRFTRDVGGVVMDLDDVETIKFHALGGVDNIVVGDLSGTDATLVAIDLEGTPVGSGLGDGASDTVTVNGTAGDDAVNVSSAGGVVTVSGLAATVTVDHAESGDRLTVNGLGGDDVINASGLAAGLISLSINGGANADFITGSAGDDTVTGGTGNDTALLGAGNDVFVWNPGDGSDTVEGQADADTLAFNGANIAEKIDISANGGRVRFTRDVASITMDTDGVETIQYKALGGADLVTVHDLSGTDLTKVEIDLGAAGGGGDGSADTVVVEGTNGDDTIVLSLQNGALVVDGLATQVVISNFESGDTISIKGLGGNDVIDATALSNAGVSLVLDGGDGNDILPGAAGADVLTGGIGDDVLLGGAGADVLDGGTGDNILIQDTASPGPGFVTIFGNGNPNTITVSRNAAGQILANGGAIVLPGTPTVANTSLIQVYGKGGDDTLALDETNGALPAAALFGEAGNDTLTGGSGGDQVFAGIGNDTPPGKGGADLLFGGDGNHVLTGGYRGRPALRRGRGRPHHLEPGDGTDLVEGGGRHRHRRGQRRQWRRGLHGDGKRHTGAVRSRHSGAILPRHWHDRAPRRQHERRRRQLHGRERPRHPQST